MARANWKRLGRRLWTDDDFYEDEFMGFDEDSVDHPGGSEHARGGRRWVHRPTCLPIAAAPTDRVRGAP